MENVQQLFLYRRKLIVFQDPPIDQAQTGALLSWPRAAGSTTIVYPFDDHNENTHNDVVEEEDGEARLASCKS